LDCSSLSAEAVPPASPFKSSAFQKLLPDIAQILTGRTLQTDQERGAIRFATAPCGPVGSDAVFDGNLFPSRPSKVGSEESADATGPRTCGRTRWHRITPSSYGAHAARDGNAFEHNQGGQPMAQDLSTSITRRSLVAGLALSAAPVALAGADYAYAQAEETTKEPRLRKVCMSGWAGYSPSRR
jgi:hypothetical protein